MHHIKKAHFTYVTIESTHVLQYPHATLEAVRCMYCLRAPPHVRLTLGLPPQHSWRCVNKCRPPFDLDELQQLYQIGGELASWELQACFIRTCGAFILLSK